MSIKETVKRLIVWLYDSDKAARFNSKAGRIITRQSADNEWVKPSRSEIRRHTGYWKPLRRDVSADWLCIYGNISGSFDHRYVPESIYYTRIEPCLNNKAFAKGYNDKNSYCLFIGDTGLPAAYVSDIEGVLYDSSRRTITAADAVAIMEKTGRFIIKPAVDSGGGKDVTLWTRDQGVYRSNNGMTRDLPGIFALYGRNFIIQEVLEQHPFYARYNPESVNTVRIFTYRSVTDNRVHILHMIFRVGAAGKITDNQASGGYACGVTPEGLLTGGAVDKGGNRHTAVNGVTLERGVMLEGIERMKTVAADIAGRYVYSRILGLDICLDSNNNVRVIEVNNVNIEINFIQMLTGPLFGEYTDEVLDYCMSNRRSFMIDFDI